MSVLMAGRERDALVFAAAGGGPLGDVNFRNRVWYPAVEATDIRRFAPRIMRHTAASWLVMDGVPLYDVQALLGHESFATTQRYAHLAPDAHSRVMESWARRRDASPTHEVSRRDVL
jgi:site-specific recombinase XerD